MPHKKKLLYRFEKATISDMHAVQKLINVSASKRLLLPRPLQSLFENARNFFVCHNKNGKVIGCCALQIVWEDLAEVRSLVVDSRYRRKGIGCALVELCLEEARMLEVQNVFALTYEKDFFKALKFKEVDKHTLPHKIWSDCMHCPQFPDCDEVAMQRKL